MWMLLERKKKKEDVILLTRIFLFLIGILTRIFSTETWQIFTNAWVTPRKAIPKQCLTILHIIFKFSVYIIFFEKVKMKCIQNAKILASKKNTKLGDLNSNIQRKSALYMRDTQTNICTSNTNVYKQTKNTLHWGPSKSIKSKHQNHKVISQNQSLNALQNNHQTYQKFLQLHLASLLQLRAIKRK